METIQAFFLLAVLLPQGSSAPVDECIRCHEKEDRWRVQEHRRGVHARSEISCADCHGGNPRAKTREEGHDPSKGFKSRFQTEEIPVLCGSCHQDLERMEPYLLDTKVWEDWKGSHHGKLFAQGDYRAPTCTNCHGTHRILSSRDKESPTFRRNIPNTCGSCHSDPDMMGETDLPLDQEKEYLEGIHGSILRGKREGNPDFVPTCVDCHGGHGATPPTVRSVPAVCGSCHFEERTYLAKSPHQASLRFTGSPACHTCHGNHRNTLPAEGLTHQNCIRCHNEEKDEGVRMAGELAALLERAESARKQMLSALEGGKLRYGEKTFRLIRSEGERALKAFSDARIRSHGLDPAAVRRDVEDMEGIVRTVLAVAEEGLEEDKAYSPTTVLVVFSALGVGLFGASLVLAFLALKLLDRNGRRTEGVRKEAVS